MHFTCGRNCLSVAVPATPAPSLHAPQCSVSRIYQGSVNVETAILFAPGTPAASMVSAHPGPCLILHCHVWHSSHARTACLHAHGHGKPCSSCIHGPRLMQLMLLPCPSPLPPPPFQDNAVQQVSANPALLFDSSFQAAFGITGVTVAQLSADTTAANKSRCLTKQSGGCDGPLCPCPCMGICRLAHGAADVFSFSDWQVCAACLPCCPLTPLLLPHALPFQPAGSKAWIAGPVIGGVVGVVGIAVLAVVIKKMRARKLQTVAPKNMELAPMREPPV